ncbi:MAG: PD-(D/E)XK nuclease family protein [Candidatus Njordarchaeales archaeon]
MSLKKLKDDFLRLLRTDEEFKLALIGALATGFVTREETNRILEEIKKLREDFNRQLEAFGRRMETLERRMEAFERRMEELREDFNRGMRAFDIKLSSLGARWGVMSESAIRNALRGLLSEKFGVRVSRWETFDKEGIVYGRPARIEVDLVIRDKEHILVEIKSHVRKSDVTELLRIKELYEKVRNVKPSLVIVTPFIEEKAREFAEANGVRVYTVEDLA